MANLHKGEVSLELDGRIYTLHAGINALADVEGVFSTIDKRVTFQEVVEHALKGSISHIRALLWAMLRRNHKDVSLADVGDLIDRVGLVAIDQKFDEVLRSVVPDPVDLKALGVDPNPPRAQAGSARAGTSKRSTRKRVASA
jgi:predicted thioredoxin/glutaredoxin